MAPRSTSIFLTEDPLGSQIHMFCLSRGRYARFITVLSRKTGLAQRSSYEQFSFFAQMVFIDNFFDEIHENETDTIVFATLNRLGSCTFRLKNVNFKILP